MPRAAFFANNVSAWPSHAFISLESSLRCKPLLELYRKRGKVDHEMLLKLRDVSYGTCTMCQRCTMYCPHGIGIAPLVHAASVVVVACHNCEDGIRETCKAYDLDAKVELFSAYLAEAVDLEAP